MSKVKIRPYNVIDSLEFPIITVDHLPINGDPIEIDKELYYVKVANIKDYLQCLSVAHRRVLFRKKNTICDFDDCDEMVIS